LKWLNISNNQLSSSIPSSINGLKNLESFDYSNTSLYFMKKRIIRISLISATPVVIIILTTIGILYYRRWNKNRKNRMKSSRHLTNPIYYGGFDTTQSNENTIEIKYNNEKEAYPDEVKRSYSQKKEKSVIKQFSTLDYENYNEKSDIKNNNYLSVSIEKSNIDVSNKKYDDIDINSISSQDSKRKSILHQHIQNLEQELKQQQLQQEYLQQQLLETHNQLIQLQPPSQSFVYDDVSNNPSTSVSHQGQSSNSYNEPPPKYDEVVKKSNRQQRR